MGHKEGSHQLDYNINTMKIEHNRSKLEAEDPFTDEKNFREPVIGNRCVQFYNFPVQCTMYLCTLSLQHSDYSYTLKDTV